MLRRCMKLAFSYLIYYKKQTIALILGMIMAVSLITGIGSLLYSGKIANLNRAREIYGDWHFMVRMDNKTLNSYKNRKGEAGYHVQRTGKLVVKETLTDPYIITFCYADKNYLDMMNRKIQKGKYPTKTGEVALDSYTIRNLRLSSAIGHKVNINHKSYILSGIVRDDWDTDTGDVKDFKIFVSKNTCMTRNIMLLYLKFDETNNVFPQLVSFAKQFNMNLKRSVFQNHEVADYVGGCKKVSIISIIKDGMKQPSGRLTFIISQLNENNNFSTKVILLALGLFGAFIIYSIFQISIIKRMSQYGVMQVLGMGSFDTFFTLLSELVTLFIFAYPIGCLLGTTTARFLYSRMGNIFVNQDIGSVQEGAHIQGAEKLAAEVKLHVGEFYISKAVVFGTGVFVAVLLIIISGILVHKMKGHTWTQLIEKNTSKRRKSRIIYSQKRHNMTGVLGQKFIFERMGTFVGIILSLSIGGVILLGTTYVTQNTQKNNELTFKADDGLGSDIQATEEVDDYSRIIPRKAAERIGAISGVASVNPVTYLLGEIPLYHNTFHWPSYYPETAGQKNFKQNQIILDNYNGIIVKESKNNYRLKVNVYGYSDKMLGEIKGYKLAGDLNLENLKKENTVILKTLMDGQGNYNGIDIKPGDTITLKVPANRQVPKEALRFQGKKSWYQEKKFKVAALVNRPLGKVNNFIGDHDSDNVAIIMSNAQMKKNFDAEDYQNISIQLEKGVEGSKIANQIRKAVGEIPHCVIKDYTNAIVQQSLYLKQRMIFFYGIGIVLLAISLLHIMNSMQYLIASRKHEFGILRAMGMTDAGFYRLMITEGIQYGIYTGIVMVAEYLIVQKVLYYFMVHVYYYLNPGTGLAIWQIGIMVLINIVICIVTVLLAGKEVLKQTIIEEIHA